MTPQENKQVELRVAGEIPLPDLYDGKDKRHFLESFIVLAKRKFFILGFVAGAAVLSAVVALVMSKYYTANAKLLPPQQSQSIASAMLGQLGPLIGAVAGKDLGVRAPNDPYVSMLHSRTLTDKLIDRFSLMSVYHKKLREDARQRLDSLTEIVVGKDGVISISVEDHDRNRAAEIANAYVGELEKLTKTLAVTDAAKRRVFFEQEVKATSDELATAEVALKQTMESTGILQLDSQTRVMLESLATLRAQVGAKEAQVQYMRSSFATPDNPDLILAEHELAALRTQLSRMERGQGGHSIADVPLEKVPSAGLEYIRKLREVKYRETLFELLAKQYEAARIDEGRDAAIVQFLDKAEPPEENSWPRPLLIILCATVLGLLIAIIWVYVQETMERAKEDPQYMARLQLLKMYLSNSRGKYE